MTDHDVWEELVAGHALNALDAGDESRLLDHLDGCAECRAELDAHLLTSSQLAALADDADTAPPAWSAIRTGILGGDAPEVVSLTERRARRRPQHLLAAAAAAVVVAGAVVVGAQAVQGSGGSTTQVALPGCVSTEGCLRIDLRASGGTKRAAVIVTGDSVRVQPVNLPRLESGRTFVLWQLPRKSAAIPLGKFSSTTTASPATKLVVPVSQTTAFAVSSEPEGDLPTTPSDVVALGGVTT